MVKKQKPPAVILSQIDNYDNILKLTKELDIPYQTIMLNVQEEESYRKLTQALNCKKAK